MLIITLNYYIAIFNFYRNYEYQHNLLKWVNNFQCTHIVKSVFTVSNPFQIEQENLNF